MQRRAGQVIGPVIGVCAVSYFAYHGVQGDRGIIAYLQLTKQIEIAEATHQRSSAARTSLEHQVSLLAPGQIDLDMLEERAMTVLNLVRPDEVVIFTTDSGAAVPATTPNGAQGSGELNAQR